MGIGLLATDAPMIYESNDVAVCVNDFLLDGLEVPEAFLVHKAYKLRYMIKGYMQRVILKFRNVNTGDYIYIDLVFLMEWEGDSYKVIRFLGYEEYLEAIR